MKSVKTLLIALMSIMLTLTAVACVNEIDDDSSSSSTPTPPPAPTREIGVMFGDETENDGNLVIDYRNALAGITFYDKKSDDQEPVTDDLTSFTLDSAAVAEENYEYSAGILELTETYIKSLELGKVYNAEAKFGETAATFTVKFTDEGVPAFKYLADDLLENVYVVGAEVELPVASKSPASVQNISATYTLTKNGSEVIVTDGKITAEEGNYVYTATFYKNGEESSVKTNAFTVIDLSTANLAEKAVAVVFGGVYDETEQAAKYTGTCALSQIEIPETYKYVRIMYKGAGKLVCGENETALSAEDYTVARVAVESVGALKFVSENGLFVKSFAISVVSAFNAEDVATLDFSKKDFFSLWKYNSDFGTPSYDATANGISFEATGNSWPYTLQQGIIKTAYDNGYKFLVITYSGKGTTRVYNDTTGDWGGYSRDLSEATSRRLAYNLEEVAKKAEIDSTSGFSIITDASALVLTEFRFFETDVVVEEEGIYNEANLVAEELTDKWSHNNISPAVYDANESAMSFPANGNADTFNFEHDALRKAQKKGYTAVKVLVKGSAGEISLFVDQNWGRNVAFAVKTNGEYVEGILYFGDLEFNEKSGIAILSSNANGGDPVLVKEMRFTFDTPSPEPDYTSMNLASKELLEKWYYNEGSGVQPSYDETEGAMVLPANGNYDTYTLSHGIVKAALAKGYNAIKFTVKGANASIRVFESGSWNSDAAYNINSESEYVTFTMYFAHLSIGDNSGITFLVSDAKGGRALYVKELKFEKITAVDEEIINLIEGNLASEENLKYWIADGKGGSASYDSEKQALKLEYTAGQNSGVKFNFDKLFYYAKLLGKTKIVWTSSADSVSLDKGRVRIYVDQDQFLAGKDAAVSKHAKNYSETDIDLGTESSVFAISNCSKAACTLIFTEIRFA